MARKNKGNGTPWWYTKKGGWLVFLLLITGLVYSIERQVIWTVVEEAISSRLKEGAVKFVIHIGEDDPELFEVLYAHYPKLDLMPSPSSIFADKERRVTHIHVVVDQLRALVFVEEAQTRDAIRSMGLDEEAITAEVDWPFYFMHENDQPVHFHGGQHFLVHQRFALSNILDLTAWGHLLDRSFNFTDHLWLIPLRIEASPFGSLAIICATILFIARRQRVRGPTDWEKLWDGLTGPDRWLVVLSVIFALAATIAATHRLPHDDQGFAKIFGQAFKRAWPDKPIAMEAVIGVDIATQIAIEDSYHMAFERGDYRGENLTSTKLFDEAKLVHVVLLPDWSLVFLEKAETIAALQERSGHLHTGLFSPKGYVDSFFTCDHPMVHGHKGPWTVHQHIPGPRAPGDLWKFFDLPGIPVAGMVIIPTRPATLCVMTSGLLLVLLGLSRAWQWHVRRQEKRQRERLAEEAKQRAHDQRRRQDRHNRTQRQEAARRYGSRVSQGNRRCGNVPNRPAEEILAEGRSLFAMISDEIGQAPHTNRRRLTDLNADLLTLLDADNVHGVENLLENHAREAYRLLTEKPKRKRGKRRQQTTANSDETVIDYDLLLTALDPLDEQLPDPPAKGQPDVGLVKTTILFAFMLRGKVQVNYLQEDTAAHIVCSKDAVVTWGAAREAVRWLLQHGILVEYPKHTDQTLVALNLDESRVQEAWAQSIIRVAKETHQLVRQLRQPGS